MKKVQKTCALAGGTALLMDAGIATESPIALFVWLTISVPLLYAGKAFNFQQNR